jgi:hypothetical protein
MKIKKDSTPKRQRIQIAHKDIHSQISIDNKTGRFTGKTNTDKHQDIRLVKPPSNTQELGKGSL